MMEHCQPCDIVHDKKHCPLCAANDRIAELEKRCEELTQQIESES